MSKKDQQGKDLSQNGKSKISKSIDIVKTTIKNPVKLSFLIAEDAFRNFAAKNSRNKSSNYAQNSSTQSIRVRSHEDEEISKHDEQKAGINFDKISILKATIGVTKNMLEHPSMIIKHPIEMVKNFDPIVFKIHAKKHPVKTAIILAAGGLAIGVAGTAAILAAPAAIAIGGVGAIALGVAAVTAASVAFTVTAAKISIDSKNTINNLSPEEKTVYDERVSNVWDKKLNKAEKRVASSFRQLKPDPTPETTKTSKIDKNQSHSL